jgi:hypothetical protein
LTFLHPIVQFDRVFLQWNVLQYRKRPLNAGDDQKVKLLETPADIFLVCLAMYPLTQSHAGCMAQLSLFICEFLQALGGLLNIRWVHNGIVEAGSYCTAQGIILQGSELTAALITLVCPLGMCLGSSTDTHSASFLLSTRSS